MSNFLRASRLKCTSQYALVHYDTVHHAPSHFAPISSLCLVHYVPVHYASISLCPHLILLRHGHTHAHTDILTDTDRHPRPIITNLVIFSLFNMKISLMGHNDLGAQCHSGHNDIRGTMIQRTITQTYS